MPPMKYPEGYPKYYRKNGLCMMRKSDTTTFDIQLPEPGHLRPLCLPAETTYPSKERLDQVVAEMQQVDQDAYEDFLFTFFQISADWRIKLNQRRQRRYAAGEVKL